VRAPRRCCCGRSSGWTPTCHTSKVTVCPQLPTEWGRVTLTDLRLGAITVHFEAEGETVKTLGVPDDWQLLTPAF
jgi:hypothetical protein